jgi:hypothetical protein
VPCSRAHTLETVKVIKSAEPLTRAAVRQLAESCDADTAAAYLGFAGHGVRAIAYPLVFWPSPAQRASGRACVRCDVGIRATSRCCRHLASIRGSLRCVAQTDPARLEVCSNQLPRPAQSQALISCARPHRSQVLPMPLSLNVTRYPVPTVLRAKGTSGCTRLTAHRADRRSLIVTAGWEPRSVWSQTGGPLFAWCWIHRSQGLLPAIH